MSIISNTKHISKIIAKIIVWCFVLLLVSDFLSLVFFSFYQPEIQKSDEIIVLGAAINSPALINRSLRGLEVYESQLAPVMMLSGGRTSELDITEAAFMKRVIDKNSKEPVEVILEGSSTSTFENLKNSKKLNPDAKSLIIVSDQFHLARASILAARNGFWPIYWTAPTPKIYSKKELSWYYFREFIAILAYLPKFVFN